MIQLDLKVGEKVCYTPKGKGRDSWENGIVKSIPLHTTKSVFVVYDFNGDEKNYSNYTAALTRLSDLKKGWHQKKGYTFSGVKAELEKFAKQNS